MKKLTWITTLVLMLLPAGLALACPMCKDSIPSSDAQTPGNLSAGFNLSIYSMIIGVFMSLGFVTSVIIKGVKNADARVNEQMRDEK